MRNYHFFVKKRENFYAETGKIKEVFLYDEKI
nr:MAG TPA: hypothetical protein [Caudoviricetes sp.]